MLFLVAVALLNRLDVPSKVTLLQSVASRAAPRKDSFRPQSNPVLTALTTAETHGCKTLAGRSSCEAKSRALAFVRARPFPHAQT